MKPAYTKLTNTKEERAQNWEAFKKMSLRVKVDYIITYFKVPIIATLVILFFVGSNLFNFLTRKNVVVYTGLINVEAGTDLQEDLTTGFLEQSEYSPKSNMVQMYQGLYLTDDPASEVFQYVYASRLKVLASIEAKELDVVLMDQEAYDTFSQSGYLLNLEDAGFDEALSDAIVSNLVIYEDNAEEHAFDETIPYEAVTGEEPNGLDCSAFSVFQKAGFAQQVYLGVIANTEHLEETEQYLLYLKKG